MKKFLLFIVVVAVGLAYFGLSYHFILFDEHLKILKKNSYTFHNTLVDARGARALKLILEPDLIKAGIKDLVGQTKGLKVPTKPPKQ